MTSEEIKNALRRTWTPFFSRFGSFTAVQEMVIPRILAGENVVVISPAATGKTEAVIAPVLENIIAETAPDQDRSLQVLYISPTRALVNDLFRRLEDPVSYLGKSISRKTGDRPRIDPSDLPAILLTTPESFDSMMSRHPKIFMALKYVILDEIHLLDNTPRGDQLRVLLNRLRRIKSGLRYCALSATIDDVKLGERYFSNSSVCLLKMPREIEYKLVPAQKFISELFGVIKERALKKILVFFNARSFVEGFSQKLNRPPFDGKVLVHHASLPKPRREEVEKAMNQSDRAMLLATSTLELGIDIGDIDCVALYRPPYTVSSLLQRVGRGNRRSNALFALGAYTNPWEQVMFDVCFDCARHGLLYERHYQSLLSVIPQQVYSYLYQRRRIGMTLNNINQVLCDQVQGGFFDEPTVKKIFYKLMGDGIVKEGRPGIYYVTSVIEKKITYGKIHSNINEKSFGEYDVFDIAQGALVGRIYYVLEKFILGGKCWEKVSVSEADKKVYARYAGSAPAVTKIFEGKGAGNYSYQLSVVLKQHIFPDLEPMEFPFAFDGRNSHILHVIGSLYSFLIAEALTAEGRDVIEAEGKLLTINNFKLEDGLFPVPKEETIRRILFDKTALFEDALGSGAFFYDLPVEYQVEDHWRNLDISGLIEFLRAVRMKEIDPDLLKSVITHITEISKQV